MTRCTSTASTQWEVGRFALYAILSTNWFTVAFKLTDTLYTVSQKTVPVLLFE